MFTLQEVGSLNELENFICQYIQKNKENVANMTIRELANEVHVSTTSILRVCKKFQCNGFAEFKVKLKMDIEQERRVNEKSDKILFDEFLEMLETTKYKIILKDVVKQINKSKMLLFLGSGLSQILAQYGSKYFTKIHKLSFLIEDVQQLKKYNLYEDSSIVVVSFSGEEEELLKGIKEIKESGGKVISITNTDKCEVAKLSDINIACYAQLKKYNGLEVPSQVYQLYILELIGRQCLMLHTEEKSIIDMINVKDIKR